MRNKWIGISLAGIIGFAANADAQISQGGIPLSYGLHQEIDQQPIQAALPNWEEYLKKETKEDDFSKPYPIGLFSETNLSFPESGTFYTNEQNQLIWKAALHINNAKALGLYFSNFKLPKGVQLFVHNDNKQHVLGAYTSDNNSEDGLFAIEAIQGSTAHIELNISDPTLMDDIQLNINQALVYFRAYENTSIYADESEYILINNTDPYSLEGSSSTCMINANCAHSEGYENQKRASVQILVPSGQGVGLCSATMINSYGNNATTCKPLLLTASHCESSGLGISNIAYSQLITRFNFEKNQCTGGPAATQTSMTGANFLTRSEYSPSMSASNLNNDFLLLELRNKIPAAVNAYLAGIRLDYNLPYIENNDKFIGFHHPSGDVKKLIFSDEIYIYNSSPQNSFHWVLQTNTDKSEGGAAQGSSGSGLFDGAGYHIGIASTAGNNAYISGCNLNGKGQGSAQFFNVLNYYQTQKANTYTHNQSAYKSISSFVNPTNANIAVIEGLDCNNPTEEPTDPDISVDELNKQFGKSIKIYPNPTSTSQGINIKTNFRFNENITFKLFDIQGKIIQTNHINQVKDQILKLETSELKPGMYLLEITNGYQKTTEKVLIQ